MSVSSPLELTPPVLMSPAQRRATVISLMLCVSLASLEATVVATAMPTVIAELGGIAFYGWVSAAYLLSSTVTVPLYGKLADIYGRKPVLLFGIALFLAGSMASGLSGTIIQLVAFRAVQGLGAGAVGPISMTIIGDMFSIEQRGKIQGAFGAVWGISGIIGPFAGGLIVKYVSWRWVFFINLPLGLAGATLLVISLRESVAKREHRIDWLGALTITVASVAVLLSGRGGSSILLLPLGLLVLGAFVAIERVVTEPILPLALFRLRAFSVASAVSVLAGGVMMGCVTYAPLFVQGVLGGSPTQSGASIAPMLVTWPIASALVGRKLAQIGFQKPIRFGSLVIALASILLAVSLRAHAGYLAIGVCAAVLGVGMGSTIPAVLVAVQSSVGWEQRGVVTASSMFFRTMGGAMVVAALGTRLASALEGKVSPETLASLLGGGRGRNLASPELASVTQDLAASLSQVFVSLAILSVVSLAVAMLFPPELPKEATDRG